MDRRTEHIVRLRAAGLCEYCRLPESISHVRFPVDHIVARQHRGSSGEGNLAVSCPTCNLHKGPNIAGIDPRTGRLARLFHPRRDAWQDHFRWRGPLLVGLTGIGRATIQVLAMNDESMVELRGALMKAGIFPKDPPRKRKPPPPDGRAGRKGPRRPKRR